ncbi:MAG: EAL domain-containing protein [Gammaproteobacteria bacterium]|nr:EAL domain-containing protein [Gammaproteobacteria bacterium]
MSYTDNSDAYYRDLCERLSHQLQTTNSRHRQALQDVHRAKVVSALMRKLFRLKSARYSARKLAERVLDAMYGLLSLECGAVYMKSPTQGGYKTLAFMGFPIEESCDLSRKTAMPEFVFADAGKNKPGISRSLGMMTNCRHTIWCFNPATGLALLLGSNHHNTNEAWELSRGDRDMLHSTLELLGNIISEAEAREESSNPLIDAMTGLPNRHMVIEHLERESRQQNRNYALSTVVLYIDIDRFKLINQQHGHVVGDKVIMAITQRLKSVLRPGDLLGRIGVDEFAIIAPGMRVGNDAIFIAERILKSLRQPLRIGAQSFYLAVSIGIAEAAPDSSAIESLRDANLAMFSAKTNGGATFAMYGQEMHQPGPDVLQLESDLRLAIDREELSLYYQPIFSLHSNAVVALEALLRWHHPVRGTLNPPEFMHLADNSEMGLLIGDWVIDKVVRDMNIWASENATNKSISVCINISETQFVQKGFISRLGRKLRDGKIDPQRIRLEISEHTLLDCRMVDKQLLIKLRDMGIKVMLDDFGTAYSSLQRLQSLPIDTLKIDRNFVAKVAMGGQHSALMKAMVSLARNLDKQIVAEGAENSAQLQELKQMGCDYAQGFLLAKPMAASKIGGFLGNQEVAMGR